MVYYWRITFYLFYHILASISMGYACKFSDQFFFTIPMNEHFLLVCYMGSTSAYTRVIVFIHEIIIIIRFLFFSDPLYFLNKFSSSKRYSEI